MTLKTVLKNFLNHVETFETRKTLGDDPYEQEFQKLKELTEKLKHDPDYACTQGLRDVNHRKNRYKDILPYDYTRVILSEYPGVPGSDYINANHIKGASGSLAYIASQGPLPNTVVDFWRMIWECEVQVIVMACNERESGKYKCECYWPHEDEKRQYGNITVELVKWRQVCPDFLVRTLRTRYGNDERTVCQFHYASWPDHGVPTSVQPILELVRLVRDCQASEALPVLVHCSAGCGRTGTICAIDYVWGLMRMGKLTENFSLFQIISDMRRQRIAMVQTKEQYVLVHRAVAALFEQQMRVIDTHTYENLDEDGEPLMLKEMKQDDEGVYEEIYIQDLPEKKEKDEKEIDKESNKMKEKEMEKSSTANQDHEVGSNIDELRSKVVSSSKESTPESIDSQKDTSGTITNSSGCEGSREDISEIDQDVDGMSRRSANILVKLRKEESIKRLISGWNNQTVDQSEAKEKANEKHAEQENDEQEASIKAEEEKQAFSESQRTAHKVRSFSASESTSGFSECKSEVPDDAQDDSVFDDTSQNQGQQKMSVPKKTSHVERIVGKATVIRRPSIAKLKALFEKSVNSDMDPSAASAEHSRRRRPLSRSHSHHLARGQMESGANFSLNTVPIRTSVKDSKPKTAVKTVDAFVGQHSQCVKLGESGGHQPHMGLPDSSTAEQPHHATGIEPRRNVVLTQVKKNDNENTPADQIPNRAKSRSHTPLQRSASEVGRQKSQWYISEVNHEQTITDDAPAAENKAVGNKLAALNCFSAGNEHGGIYVGNDTGGLVQMSTWYSQLDSSEKHPDPCKPDGTSISPERSHNSHVSKASSASEASAVQKTARPSEPAPPALPIKKKVLRVGVSEATRRGSISYSTPLKLKEKSIVSPLVPKRSASEKRTNADGQENKDAGDAGGNPPSLPVKKVLGRHGSLKNYVVYQDIAVCNNQNGEMGTAETAIENNASESSSTQYTNVNVTAKKNIEIIENTIEQHPRGAIIDLTSRQSYIADQISTKGSNTPDTVKSTNKMSLPKAVSCEFVRSTGEECIMVAAKQCSGYEAIWINKNGPSSANEATDASNDNNSSLASLSSTDTVGKLSDNTAEVHPTEKVKANDQDERDADRNLLLHSPPPRSKRTHITRSNSKPGLSALPLMAVNPSWSSLEEGRLSNKSKDRDTSEISRSSKDLSRSASQEVEKALQGKGLGRRSRTLVTSSSSSNLLDLNQNSEHRAHSSMFSRTAFELNLETEVPSLSMSSNRSKIENRALGLSEQNNQKKSVESCSNSTHYQIYDVPAKLTAFSNGHQHLQQNPNAVKVPYQSNTEYEYLYPLQRSASTPHYNTHKEEQTSEYANAQRIFETWAPRRSREDEYQLLARNVYPQQMQQADNMPLDQDASQKNSCKIVGNGPPKPPRTYNYTNQETQVAAEPKKQSRNSPPRFDGGRLIVSVASPKRNVLVKPESKSMKTESNQKSSETKSSKSNLNEKVDGSPFGNNSVNHPSAHNHSSATHANKVSEGLLMSRSFSAVPNGGVSSYPLSVKPAENPVYSMVDRQTKELQRAKSLKHDKTRHHTAYQTKKVQEYPQLYQQARSHNVVHQHHKHGNSNPYKSPPTVHLYENVYGCYGVIASSNNRKDCNVSSTNPQGQFCPDDKDINAEDHSLMRLQSDSSVYAVLRGEKNPPSVVMNRPAQPPSYSQVIKLKNESKLFVKDSKESYYSNNGNLEEERKSKKQSGVVRADGVVKPVAPPRTKRLSKHNHSQENMDPEWNFKGHSTQQKNQNIRNQIQDDDSDNEGTPVIPAKTKAAYEMPDKAEHKKSASSGSDSSSRGGTLSRALWAKLTQLTKLGSKSVDPFDSDPPKPDVEGAGTPVVGDVTEQQHIVDVSKHAAAGDGGVTRSDMVFPNRIHKPSGPRESPKQWTQV